MILDIADEIGLMVSEEPGLWWSDTSDPEVCNGSLEVLRRTILRDRNHPSIMFWLSFNECKFTKEYLIESAKVCRANDHTRLVSGANCMTNEETLEYYNLCEFDFYTMHPYSQTIDRAKESARILNDKPLLFTEWGGHFVYDNPKLLAEFIAEMYKLYLNNSSDGALAGACFWEWSELNDYNRGMPACIDGMLYEGLVDANRNPNLIYQTFSNSIKNLGQNSEYEFWSESEFDLKFNNIIKQDGDKSVLKTIIDDINDSEANSGKLRKRRLAKGPVLKNVSFKIKPGMTVGILGPTGSGKSTIAKLMCRYYDTVEGSVLLDGVDVKNYDLQYLRQNIGITMQEVFLFSDTVEGNIAFGVPEASFEDVEASSELARVKDFIADLTDGYDTIVGERGVGLSGGQKQRIALARLFLANPKVMILDDTTSAVDIETEEKIRESIKTQSEGHTTFIISHRVSSFENADLVLVIQNGEIVEQGTHKELVEGNGYYNQVWKDQNGKE